MVILADSKCFLCYLFCLFGLPPSLDIDHSFLECPLVCLCVCVCVCACVCVCVCVCVRVLPFQ